MPHAAPSAAVTSAYCIAHTSHPFCTPISGQDIGVVIGVPLAAIVVHVAISLLLVRVLREATR